MITPFTSTIPVNVETDYAVWPGEFLVEWLNEHHLDGADPNVLEDIGWDRQRMSAFLAGSVVLTEKMAVQLEGLMRKRSTHVIPSRAWLRYEALYRSDLRRLETAAGRFSGPETELAVAIALKGTGYRSHIYDGGRCLFCGVNDLDETLYGDADLLLPEEEQEYRCVDRGQYHYSTNSKPAEEPGDDDKNKNGAANG